MKSFPHTVLLVTLLLVAFTACTPRPKGVLSQQKMVKVLYELHRADGILQTQGYNYGHEEELNRYYGTVLQKQEITQAQFDSSLVWYTAHPKQFARIYPRVVALLDTDVKALQEPSAEYKPMSQLAEEQKAAETRHQRPRLNFEQLHQQMMYGLPLPEVATVDSVHVSEYFLVE